MPDEIPADLLELQRRRDAAFAATEAFAREVPRPDHAEDAEGHAAWTHRWERVQADQRDAVEALHAHPYLAPGPDRFKRVQALRRAVAAADAGEEKEKK